MSALSNLCSVPGVKGAALFGPDGNCIEHQLPAPYEPALVLAVLHEVTAGLDGVEFLDGAASRMGLGTFSDGFIGVLVSEPFSVLVLGGPDFNPNLLWVAFGALESKLRRSSNTGSLTSVDLAGADGSTLPGSDEPELPTGSPMVPSPELERLQSSLARHVGPVARLLIDEHIVDLGGHDRVLPEILLPQLVQRLAASIDVPSEREAFLREVDDG